MFSKPDELLTEMRLLAQACAQTYVNQPDVGQLCLLRGMRRTEGGTIAPHVGFCEIHLPDTHGDRVAYMRRLGAQVAREGIACESVILQTGAYVARCAKEGIHDTTPVRDRPGARETVSFTAATIQQRQVVMSVDLVRRDEDHIEAFGDPEVVYDKTKGNKLTAKLCVEFLTGHAIEQLMIATGAGLV